MNPYMERKEIQEQRMRNYFIEATREILKGEGLKSVNVRAIAERAGYSYATLYNYFKDIKELVFICVQDFQQEAETLIREQLSADSKGKARLKETSRAYIAYFTQYPGIFELFFLEKMNTLSGKQPTAGLIYSFLKRLTSRDWAYCVEQGIFTEEEAAKRMQILNYSVTGLLLMYMNRMHPDSYAEFMEHVEQQLNFIICD